MTPRGVLSALREWTRRLWGALSGRRTDHDLQRELAGHLAFAEEELRRQGHAPDEAARLARVIASPPASVSPQFLTSWRSPSLTSSHDEPSQGSPRCSRSASSAWMRPPAAARASRAASAGE